MSFNIDNYFSGQPNENLIFYYKGKVDSDVIQQTLDLVEKKLSAENENLKLRKKVYNVLVESLQNLYHHVDKVPNEFGEQCDKFGILRIIKLDGVYKIATGNFIFSENVEILEEKIKKINKSSYDEIKALYKHILNNQSISAKGGGGLGLVDIARKTGNKFDYSFVKYNDQYSFIYISILINEGKEECKNI
jgi:hypothetical protein